MELALREVPNTLREVGCAIDASPARVIFRLTMRWAMWAMRGIVTGVLPALAISVGETARLLLAELPVEWRPHAFTDRPSGRRDLGFNLASATAAQN